MGPGPWLHPLDTDEPASPLIHAYARLNFSDLTSEPAQYPCIYSDDSLSPETLDPETSPVPGSSDVTFSMQQYTSRSLQVCLAWPQRPPLCPLQALGPH